MNQLKIKNHYVPETYLKAWAGNDSKLAVYRTLVSNSNCRVWGRYTPAAIAYQKHLYVRFIAGNESDELEDWFNEKYETPFDEVINKIQSELLLTKSDWKVLINFLAAQDVRTPASLYKHLERAREYIKDYLNSATAKLAKINAVAELKQEFPDVAEEGLNQEPFLKINYVDVENPQKVGVYLEGYAGRATWIHTIKYFLTNTSRVLHQHHWTIVKPAKGYCWPTSDNPVVKLNYYGSDGYDLKGGWGVENGYIFSVRS